MKRIRQITRPGSDRIRQKAFSDQKAFILPYLFVPSYFAFIARTTKVRASQRKKQESALPAMKSQVPKQKVLCRSDTHTHTYTYTYTSDHAAPSPLRDRTHTVCIGTRRSSAVASQPRVSRESAASQPRVSRESAQPERDPAMKATRVGANTHTYTHIHIHTQTHTTIVNTDVTTPDPIGYDKTHFQQTKLHFTVSTRTPSPRTPTTYTHARYACRAHTGIATNTQTSNTHKSHTGSDWIRPDTAKRIFSLKSVHFAVSARILVFFCILSYQMVLLNFIPYRESSGLLSLKLHPTNMPSPVTPTTIS